MKTKEEIYLDEVKRASELDEKFAKNITKDSDKLQGIMRSQLFAIYNSIKDKLAPAYRNAPASQKNSAFTQISTQGNKNAYAATLQEELARVAFEAQLAAKASLPIAIRRKLSEESMTFSAPRGGFFGALSPKIRRLVKSQAALISETQVYDLEKVVYFQFASSAAASESIETILNDIDSKVNPTLVEDSIKAGNIATAAGDAVAQVANQTWIETYFEPDAFDAIESFTFVNEDPVSEICQALEGTTLAPGDPDFMRYQTPLHHNCKSHWEPNFKGSKDSPDIERDGLSLSKKALGSITLAENAVHQVFSRE